MFMVSGPGPSSRPGMTVSQLRAGLNTRIPSPARSTRSRAAGSSTPPRGRSGCRCAAKFCPAAPETTSPRPAPRNDRPRLGSRWSGSLKSSSTRCRCPAASGCGTTAPGPGLRLAEDPRRPERRAAGLPRKVAPSSRAENAFRRRRSHLGTSVRRSDAELSASPCRCSKAALLDFLFPSVRGSPP